MKQQEESEELELSDQGDEEIKPEKKFDAMQKVLARDRDGLLYEAVIRRSLFGMKHHTQELIGMCNSREEAEQPAVPSWHYFVSFSKWKTCWDRWVSENDVLEFTLENQDLAKRILEEHKSLQKEFKNNKKRKITDSGGFLKAWKGRLDKLMVAGKDPTKKEKPTRKPSKQTWEKDFRLRTKQSLTLRKGPVSQQMVLPFGLKKILVEEWEIINQFDMVHQLPAHVTVRQALDLYVQSKGLPQLQHESSETQGNDPNKEWIEMADGIASFFEQALPFRLLYPSERSQLAVLEISEESRDKPKAELFGCEFLLRLFSHLPAILADAYDGDEDVTKPLLAKLNDIIRFFQKNQSNLFAQSYRKKNENELILEQKIAKRQERKRKLIESKRNH